MSVLTILYVFGARLQRQQQFTMQRTIIQNNALQITYDIVIKIIIYVKTIMLYIIMFAKKSSVFTIT